MHEAEPLAVQRYLNDLEFPASKQDLIATAAANAAPQEMIEALQKLAQEQFNSERELVAALA